MYLLPLLSIRLPGHLLLGDIYIRPSVSTRDWFQEPWATRIPKSANDQIPYNPSSSSADAELADTKPADRESCLSVFTARALAQHYDLYEDSLNPPS